MLLESNFSSIDEQGVQCLVVGSVCYVLAAQPVAFVHQLLIEVDAVIADIAAGGTVVVVQIAVGRPILHRVALVSVYGSVELVDGARKRTDAWRIGVHGIVGGLEHPVEKRLDIRLLRLVVVCISTGIISPRLLSVAHDGALLAVVADAVVPGHTVQCQKRSVVGTLYRQHVRIVALAVVPHGWLVALVWTVGKRPAEGIHIDSLRVGNAGKDHAGALLDGQPRADIVADAQLVGQVVQHVHRPHLVALHRRGEVELGHQVLHVQVIPGEPDVTHGRRSVGIDHRAALQLPAQVPEEIFHRCCTLPTAGHTFDRGIQLALIVYLQVGRHLVGVGV